MTFSDESYNLRIELDTKGCELSAEEIEDMELDLHTLRNLVADFPVSDLHITVVYHQKARDYHVKTSLALSGKTLFTGERHSKVHPAFESCIRKLTKKVRAYKRQMRVGEDAEKHAAGTRHDVAPLGEINVPAIIRAVDDDDYHRFRQEMDVFESSLASRISHWVERYPEIGSRLEHPFQVSDIVEEVFLNAFDSFAQRSHDISPGQWLESLIDPSVQALLQSPDEEYERIQFARMALMDCVTNNKRAAKHAFSSDGSEGVLIGALLPCRQRRNGEGCLERVGDVGADETVVVKKWGGQKIIPKPLSFFDPLIF